MGKNQITIKDSTIQSQVVCDKIFKSPVNKSPIFQSFRRISPDETPKFSTNSAKSCVYKPVAFELNHQQIQNLSSASNMVLVDYNHIEGDMNNATHKSKNMFNIVHHDEINEGPPKDDNERFSNYIDYVKTKMRNMSNFDDDHKVTHHYIVDRSKFKIN